MSLRPFLIAVQFLTRFPIRLNQVPSQEEMGQSVLYFPLVGLLIGVLLILIVKITVALHVSVWLSAALVVTSWVLATGGLHLDGLADSVDAWAGGRGDRARTLEIMKDPTCGAMAITAVFLVLLLKVSALTGLVSGPHPWRILIAPILGRAVLPLLFLTTPYVNPVGLGAAMRSCLPRWATVFVITLVCLGLVLGFGFVGLLVLAIGTALYLLLWREMKSVIGGMTGDTAGALVEIMEAVILVSVSMLHCHGWLNL